MAQTVEVGVKSAWLSKINWTQTVGVLASVLVVFGIDIPVETQLAIVGLIQGVVALVTWGLKTFGTTTVTPSSASKA
jgi:hypothetical protein